MIETAVQQAKRWADLQALQEHYTDFRDFYHDCSLDLIGFVPTEEQYDIAQYAAHGPHYCMIQAQRGEAKTTITGCYAVWSLIRNPATRILIVSAGTKMAKQISVWCIQIINGMPELECLRVDSSHPGARASVEAYDVHHTLKGAEKSPSIACLGITSTSQGYRADLLIPDDIESAKNSMTAHMREQLRHLTRDFTAINAKGRIIYLGTPQSTESIYNELPARGFGIRIWPGRYPTLEEEPHYNGKLAPMITKAMALDPTLREGGGMLGDRGKPTDPLMCTEEMLVKKENDQGAAYFNLQYMLDTSLSDLEKFPLKLCDLLFYSFDMEDAPRRFTWSADPAFQIHHAVGSSLKDPIYRAAKVTPEFLPYTYKLLSIDPAGGGQNGDETGISVLYANSCGWIAAMYIGGLPGGSDPRKLEHIVNLAKKWDVHDCIIEKNFGYDAWPNALTAACADKDWPMSIETVWATGQKEKRIIDSLEPVIGSHKLIINTSCLAEDVALANKYPTELRSLYQWLFQMKFITRDRGALIHEDRLEALSQGVTHLMAQISADAPNDGHQIPVNTFKGFKLGNDGKWAFAHRVADGVTSGAVTTLMSRFRR